jgi:hypothetical protein
MAAAALSAALSDRMARGDSFFDQIGLTQLRAEVPTLTGAGVIVAQPEATTVDADTGFDHDNYQVNGPTAGVTATITYIGKAGTITSFDNSLVSGHANVVAQYLASSTQGVAPGITRLININANRFANAYVLPNNTISPFPPKIINQSFSEEPSGPYTAAVLDQVWDNYAAANNLIIVSAAGNGGAIIQPGTAYNTITVGVYPSGFSSVSSPGERAKPDIVAPTRQQVDNFSSFTTPIVSGAAALMVQAAGGNSATGADPRVVKSVLLNGAVKPADWTHSAAVPLDRQYGAGIINVYNSYKNLTAGQHAATLPTATTSLGGAHNPIDLATNSGLAGWNLATITSTPATDAVDHYLLDLSTASALTTITTTLNWFRANDPALTTEIKNSNSSTSSFTSAINTINNLDLYLYNVNGGTLSDLSNSSIDNVEHLYTLNLAPGKYDLQVLKHGGNTGTADVFSHSETYGMAFSSASQSTAINNSTIIFNQTNSVTINTAISGTGGLTKAGTGTTTIVGAYTATGPMTVSTGKLAFAPTAAARRTSAVLVTTKNLLINSGSVLDITNHDLMITNNSPASATLISTWVTNGTATLTGQGNPSGPQITSSTANNDTSSFPTFIVAFDMDSIFGGGTTGDGSATGKAYGAYTDNVTVTQPGTVMVKFSYYADIDFSGKVDAGDINLVLGSLGQTTPGLADKGRSYLLGDVDFSGKVDAGDINLVLGMLGAGSGGAHGNPLGLLDDVSAPALVGASAPVPEPASLALLTLGAGTLLLRRKRKIG